MPTSRTFGRLLVVAGSVALAVAAFGGTAGATKPNPEHKVTLCHRTDSYTNPYVSETVDVASVKFRGHDDHNGPVFYPSIPKHTKWGDIIPAFDFGGSNVYPGQNLTPEGLAILHNGCMVPQTGTTTTSEATTT